MGTNIRPELSNKSPYHDNKAIDEKHILLWEQIVRII